MGPHVGYRVGRILSMVDEFGMEFFNTYSTELDSILNYLKILKERGFLDE